MHLCNEKITVYNSYIDPITRFRTYLPTVVDGVSWFGDLQVSVTSDGLVSANQYIIRIPSNADTSNKEYKSRKEYENTPVQNLSSCWTLCEGDIIVRGAVTDSGDDAKPSKLSDKYDDVITVVSVTDNRRVNQAPHLKVVGK